MPFAPIEWIEKHPYSAAGVAAVVVVGAIFIISSGAGGATQTTSNGSDYSSLLDSELQASSQQAQIQAQIQGQTNQINGQITEDSQNNAAALSLATIQGNSQNSANTIAAQVSEYTTQAQTALGAYQTQEQAETQQLNDTLAAQTAQYTTGSQVTIDQANNNAQIALAAGTESENLAIANTNAQVQQAQIGAGIVSANLSAQTAQDQIASGERVAADNNATTLAIQAALTEGNVDETNANDALQYQIAGITAATQDQISANQLQLGITQSNNATALGTIQSNNQTNLGITDANDDMQTAVSAYMNATEIAKVNATASEVNTGISTVGKIASALIGSAG